MTRWERYPYGMSDSEYERNRTCQREHHSSWAVDVYRANYSAFNGGRRTPSDYSQVRCGTCGRVWRTKAAYVEDLPWHLPGIPEEEA